MAIDVNKWTQKFPDIDREILVNYLTDFSIQGYTDNEIEELIRKDINAEPVEEAQTEPEDGLETTELPENEEIEDTEPDEGEVDVEPENDFPLPDIEPDDSFKDQLKQFKPKPRNESTDPDIPYDNPDINDLEMEGMEQEEDDDDEEMEDPEETPQPYKTPDYKPSDMITKTVTYQEYDEIIKPFRPFLEQVTLESNSLNKLAGLVDPRYMPPYMQIKSYILNHPIKDPHNTMILVWALSDSNTKRLEQRHVNIIQAIDITDAIAKDGWYEEGFHNYFTILEKFQDDRKSMVSLIYILENYCEQKQISPFELSVPKQILTDAIEESFQSIKELIANNVVEEMSTLRKGLQGEMLDVGDIVEKNMNRFDTSIQDAVTKVMWKVKTDVESTNLEDIKRSILWVLNKRSASYNLGGASTAVIGMMLDDLERKLLETGFKIDDVKHQIYTISELSQRLGYKSQSNVVIAIKRLIQRSLIKVYANKNVSL